ncbi:hypothetical protein FOCG_13544 [Fusarium oxysporum f. sp. radicis-lycopersici 26381]|uniref:Apple domain-containing protein n=4 Tax=Fusarium oxysporum TaxID=5507 RepID=A0A2H3GPP7_FUSOX|nr:hypothetical protein FOZG_09171 [Fusarium oxysporum Fo47]EWZ87401.1 hypothetical protein FOWG_09280 [Fusarium oxysporum f. sp. lycopersici MN25]EXL44578.1 hypothetical protein FOCG_13544 [Fusarium oxysporum f. sp. radicis-lycopersici 26381]KAJ4151950.1 hypothetical protein NW765_013481 [Fusarium oxysporum]PCD32747.1 hypothetical protein AU210_008989 [Fusarium oxysporum f. sp. radicis-cucumerinum]RKK16242.1 hypothetical protein BFJ65_g9812 [Fusarium oxysporum f. sp. cepae]RYC88032.1 hypothe
MSESRYHEGLEVYSDSAAHAPEVNPHGVYSQGSKDPISGYVQVVEARKGPFGLSILSLCALVAIITAVVVGAGVGGGLGSALADCKNSQVSEAPAASAIQTSACPTLTASASETTETAESKFYEPKPADQVTNLTLPDACSQPNGKDDYTTTNGYGFTYTCGFDYPGNDIVPILAYTAFDCMHACAMYTEINSGKENATLCDSIAFNREMAKNYEVKGGNCWLKTGTRDLFPASDLMPTFLYAKRNS